MDDATDKATTATPPTIRQPAAGSTVPRNFTVCGEYQLTFVREGAYIESIVTDSRGTERSRCRYTPQSRDNYQWQCNHCVDDDYPNSKVNAILYTPTGNSTPTAADPIHISGPACKPSQDPGQELGQTEG
jgi:hypothetical protein